MFIGHYALGLAAGKVNKVPSLAMLFIAVQLLDLIWPILVLLGIESFQIEPGNTSITPLNFTFYPYSHSLLMAVVWGALLAGIYQLITKNRNGSILLFVLVISHWFLDFITHRPDLPLSPFSDFKVGLGLWNYPAMEIVIEFGMFIAGTFLYYRSARPKRKVSFWILIAFFAIVHTMNLIGPPPPDTMVVAWSANLMWLIVLWAWWIEKEKNA